VSGDVWACDACETHNPGDRSACRTCGRQAGSTTETAVLPTPDTGAGPRRTDEPEPDFRVHAKYEETAAQSRVQFSGRRTATTGRPAPPPPRITLPAPPPPPPRPVFRPPPPPPMAFPRPAPRTPPPKIPKPVMVVGVLFILVVMGKACSNGTSGRTGTTYGAATATTAAATPCPPRVAKWMPGGTSSATLIAAYQTPQHLITLCRGVDGSVRYDGQVKGQLATPEFHISLPARATPTGYTAQNLDYTYEIKGSVVIVTKGLEVISETALQPAS
jgi:hypothetical protein